MENIIGFVKNSKFVSAETRESFNLTKIRIMEARPPDSAPLDVSKHEDKAIMITYENMDSGWLYNSSISDVAAPILSIVVEKVFGKN